MDLAQIRSELRSLADPDTATFLARYFRTGHGEYGEGDRFLGIRVPPLRSIARRARDVPVPDALELLRSRWHEERLLALLILVERYRRGAPGEREEIHRAYLAHRRHVDNWDLVDASAPHLVGAHVHPDDLGTLEQLAGAASVWERRIAMLATLHWIRRHEFAPALAIANRLVDDDHDLIHKAVGWMLREIGKRDREVEERFLRTHFRTMPRTMLRYAIEHFPPAQREAYLRGRVASE
jgi:3-methyladenine DNA glycosylase AlkD